MKNTPEQSTSRRSSAQRAHLLHLGRLLEGAYGAGVMSTDQKREAKRTGWTTQQLLNMSAAKSFYN
ncbi:MAG: hypothetical protein WA885_15935 [Phormidesmis sp.]